MELGRQRQRIDALSPGEIPAVVDELVAGLEGSDATDTHERCRLVTYAAILHGSALQPALPTVVRAAARRLARADAAARDDLLRMLGALAKHVADAHTAHTLVLAPALEALRACAPGSDAHGACLLVLHRVLTDLSTLRAAEARAALRGLLDFELEAARASTRRPPVEGFLALLRCLDVLGGSYALNATLPFGADADADSGAADDELLRDAAALALLALGGPSPPSHTAERAALHALRAVADAVGARAGGRAARLRADLSASLVLELGGLQLQRAGGASEALDECVRVFEALGATARREAVAGTRAAPSAGPVHPSDRVHPIGLQSTDVQSSARVISPPRLPLAAEGNGCAQYAQSRATSEAQRAPSAAASAAAHAGARAPPPPAAPDRRAGAAHAALATQRFAPSGGADDSWGLAGWSGDEAQPHHRARIPPPMAAVRVPRARAGSAGRGARADAARANASRATSAPRRAAPLGAAGRRPMSAASTMRATDESLPLRAGSTERAERARAASLALRAAAREDRSTFERAQRAHARAEKARGRAEDAGSVGDAAELDPWVLRAFPMAAVEIFVTERPPARAAAEPRPRPASAEVVQLELAAGADGNGAEADAEADDERNADGAGGAVLYTPEEPWPLRSPARREPPRAAAAPAVRPPVALTFGTDGLLMGAEEEDDAQAHAQRAEGGGAPLAARDGRSARPPPSVAAADPLAASFANELAGRFASDQDFLKRPLAAADAALPSARLGARLGASAGQHAERGGGGSAYFHDAPLGGSGGGSTAPNANSALDRRVLGALRVGADGGAPAASLVESVTQLVRLRANEIEVEEAAKHRARVAQLLGDYEQQVLRLQRELADSLEQESREAERRIAANVEQLLVAGVPAIQQALAVQLPASSQ